VIAAEGAENEHLSDGRLSRSQALSISGVVWPAYGIVMVIAIGKKSRAHDEPPQWRRLLDAAVTILMNSLPRKEIPDDILKDSVLANIAATYFSVGKRRERKTQCSATRGFILSTLRGRTTLNQNQIATLLGFDRTVVHRAIKSLAKEGLVSEHRAKSG
jgi:hypothetical protein